MNLPDLKYEIELWEKGFIVIGIDEVGRGAFAGPLFAAGVAFKPNINNEYLLSLGINDSKKLTAPKRKMLAKIIQNLSLAYYINTIHVAEINRFGVGQANSKALRNVVWNFSKDKIKTPLFALIDGFSIKNIHGIEKINQQTIVRGDSISLSIAAASIIAKVARDEYMEKLSIKFPEYCLDKNKGYGTQSHRNALKKYGQTNIHRKEFIKKYI